MPDFRNIDQNQILQWVDTGLLIAFVVVLAGFLLAFLRGLLRGWKQGTYRFVVLGAILVTLLCLLPVFADIVGNIDLRTWLKEPVTITMEGKSFELKFGTVFETGYNYIYGLLHDIYQVKSSPEAIANYSIALTGSIIRLVLVFLIAFLTETVIAFLVWILWHIAFKRFIKKERRHPTLRPVSGLEEVATWFVLMGLTLVPFTGIFNAIHNNGELPQDSENETVGFVNRILKTYDDSIFNKAFFAWTKGSGKDTIDTQIAQFFADNVYVKDTGKWTANFITELRVFSSLEGTMVNWMFNENPSQGTVSSIIETSVVIGETLYSLAARDASSLMNGIVPLTLDVAYSLEPIQEELGLIEDVSPRGLKAAYRKVAEADYVSAIESVETGEYAVACYDSSAPYGEATYESVRRLVEADPSSRELVNQIVSGYVLAEMETNPEWQKEGSFASLLPHDEAALADIDWWKEASILHEFDVAAGYPSILMADQSSQDQGEMLRDSFLNALADRPQGLIELLVGKRDASGEPQVDGNGRDKSNLCLLDSDLISVMLPLALEVGGYYAQESVLTDEEDPNVRDGVAEIALKLQGSGNIETRVNFKRELGSVLDVLGKVAETEMGKAYIRNYESHPGLEFASDGTLIELDPELAKSLMGGIESIDRSEILSYLGPNIGDHFMRPMLKEGALHDMGIEKIDLHVDKLGKALSDLLSAGVYCTEFVSYLGGLFHSGAGENDANFDVNVFLEAISNLETEEGQYQVSHLLDIFTGSPILNPVIEVGGVSRTNRNIENLLNYIFSNVDLDGEKIEIRDGLLDGLTLSSGWDGAQIDKDHLGENYFILRALRHFVDPVNGVVAKIGSISGASSAESTKALSSLDIEGLFGAIGDSVVMRSVSTKVLDKFLIGTLLDGDNALGIKELGITYENLLSAQDWYEEGEAMQAILDLATRGLDLSHLDFFSPTVIKLFQDLAKSEIFFTPVYDDEGHLVRDDSGKVVREYSFPKYVGDKLLLSMTTPDLLHLLGDYPNKTITACGVTDTVEHIIDMGNDWDKKESLDDKRIVCSTFIRSVNLLTTPEDWDREFTLLGRALSATAAIGGLDGFKSVTAENIPALTLALDSLTISDAFGPVLVGNIFLRALTNESVPKEISGGGETKPNVGYFFRNADEFLAAKAAGTDIAPVRQRRVAEVHSLVNLINLTLGNDKLTDDQGNFNLNFATLDVEAFLRPVLESTVHSKIFNPLTSADMYSDDETVPSTTVFENLLLTFLKQSGVYISEDGASIADYDTPVKGTNKSLRLIVDGVENWDAEIENVCELVAMLQHSDFLNDEGQFDLEALKDLEKFFANPSAIEDLRFLLIGTQNSDLFYRSIPPKLDSAFADSMTGIELDNIDDDLKCADFYYNKTADGNDLLPYPSQEIDTLVDVFENLSHCTKIKLTDMSTVKVEPLVNALTEMGCSRIFNENTDKSIDVFGPKGEILAKRGGLTCYQCILCDVTLINSLEPYYWLEESPKDQANAAIYTNAKTKIVTTIPTLLPSLKVASEDEFRQDAVRYLGEEWAQVLRLLKQPRYTGFIEGSVAFEDLSEECFSNLLHTLNDCTIYRDCVPNAFYDALINKSTIDVEGIDLGSANVFFSYYYYEGDSFSPLPHDQPNFEMRFYDPEIDQIAMLYTLLKDQKDDLSDIHMDSVDELAFHNILIELHDSYVFHEARKDMRRPQVFNEHKSFQDFTVFEQFMYKIMVDTTLCEANFSAHKDYHYATGYGDNGQYYKLHDLICGFTTQCNDLWRDEVEALTTDGHHHVGDDADPYVGIVAAGKAAGIFDSSSEVGVNYDALNKIAPSQTKSLLYAINRSSLLSSVLPNRIGELLSADKNGKGLGLSKFTLSTITFGGLGGNDSFDMRDYPDFFLDGEIENDFHPIKKLDINLTAPIGNNYHVYLSDGTDVTSLVTVKPNNAPGVYAASFDMKDFPLAMRVELDGGVKILDDVSITFDSCYFDIGRAKYESNGIPAIGTLLSSAYRGTSGGTRTEDLYFSFNDTNDDTLQSFFDDPGDFRHSTYGILRLFGDSGFYDRRYDENGAYFSDGEHTAGAKALYNALSFHADAHVTIQMEIAPGETVTFPSEADIVIGDHVGRGGSDVEHMASITEYLDRLVAVSDYVREASWFDTYASHAGTMDVYAAYQGMALHEDEIDGKDISNPYIHLLLAQGVDLAFAQNAEAIDSMRKLMEGYEYHYSIEVPESDEVVNVYEEDDAKSLFGQEIIADLLQTMQYNKADTVDLEAVRTVPSNPLPAARYTRIGDSSSHVMEEWPQLLDTYFDILDRPVLEKGYLNEVSSLFRAMEILHVDAADMTPELKTELGNLFSSVDSAKRLTDLFYLASFYDRMVDVHHIFGQDAAGRITDFPVINGAAYIEDGLVPFSYANIASLLA